MLLEKCKKGDTSSGYYKREGELWVRTLSEKAQAGYNQAQPCDVYAWALTKKIVIHDASGWQSFEYRENAEKYLEGLAVWYAVLRDENDTEHGTGSYDYTEAVKMAMNSGCEYIGSFTADDYCIEVTEI